MKKSIQLSFIALFGLLTACNGSTDKQVEATQPTKDTLTVKEETTPEVVIPTVQIGSQTWMKDDLSTVNYNNGDPILEAKTDKQWAGFGTKKQGCYRKLANGAIMYSGFALTDSRGIIPEGFRVPEIADFKKLFGHLGGGEVMLGEATKAVATYPIFVDEWSDDEGGLVPSEIKTNGKSGFNAKMGGFVYDNGHAMEGNCTYWWTSTKEGKNLRVMDIGYCSQDLGGGEGSHPLSYGFSVRAIKR